MNGHIGTETRPKLLREAKAGKLGAWRKQAATRLTGLVVMDIDHVEEPRRLFEGWNALVQTTPAPFPTDGRLPVAFPNLGGEVKDSSPELGEDRRGLNNLGILLVYVTPSGHGLKIVFKADPAKGNLIDNQHAMAKVLGVEVDESCKDASRMSFICKEEDILFIDKELFTYENKEFAEKYESEYRAGHSRGASPATASLVQTTPTPFPTDGRLPVAFPNSGGEQKRATESPLPLEGDRGRLEVMWRGYDIQGIIDQRYADKLPCKDDSNRHAESLKLATDLLLMLDGDKALVQQIVEAQPWVQEIIDERNENVAQTVESAAQQMVKREGSASQPYPSKVMQEAVKRQTGKTYQELVSLVQTTPAPFPTDGRLPVAFPNLGGELMTTQLEEWGKEIESLWDEFPLLKDVCAGLKRTQYPAALFVAGGLLMTLMTRCWYRFYHKPQKERRLNCSLFVIGHPASGKSMADDLYNILAQPIMKADEAGKKALNEYKNSTRKKAANKEGKDKPKVVIRIHPARTANGQFITDMINAREDVNGKQMQLHMFTFDTELDNSITLQSGGSWINKLSMELKAFQIGRAHV